MSVGFKLRVKSQGHRVVSTPMVWKEMLMSNRMSGGMRDFIVAPRQAAFVAGH